VRLLTIETSWLNRPPLSSDETRSAIARACAAVLTNEDDAYDPGIRWQAAIVLRVASKAVFIECFPAALGACVNDQTVAAELCHGMLTLIERPYNHHSSILKLALDALQEARELVLTRVEPQEAPSDVRMTLNAVHRRATELRRRTAVGSQDALVSWNMLKRSYVEPMRKHDGVLTSMFVVLNAFSGPSATERAAGGDDGDEAARAHWQRVGDAWSRCWDFLANAVFPHLPALRDQLEPMSSLTGGAVPLLELDGERAAQLSESLRTLERYPRWFSPGVRASLEIEARQWFDAFLRGPGPQSVGRRDSLSAGALLLRVLEETPCDLASAWDAAVHRARDAGFKVARVHGDVPGQRHAFCPRLLLTDVLGQVLENAARTHVMDGCPDCGVDVLVRESETPEVLTLRVMNNWSTASAARHGGLTHFKDELALFGATLEHRDVAHCDDTANVGWTHEVSITMRRWRELK